MEHVVQEIDMLDEELQKTMSRVQEINGRRNAHTKE